jgi:hypothetical protein
MGFRANSKGASIDNSTFESCQEKAGTAAQYQAFDVNLASQPHMLVENSHHDKSAQ